MKSNGDRGEYANPTDPAFVDYSNPVPTTSTGSYTIPLPRSLPLSRAARPAVALRRVGDAHASELDQLRQRAPIIHQSRLYDHVCGNSTLKPSRPVGRLLGRVVLQPKSALTLAVFGKDLKDTITTVRRTTSILAFRVFQRRDHAGAVLYEVQQPINGDKAYVEGIEFGFQHMLENGFGVM